MQLQNFELNMQLQINYEACTVQNDNNGTYNTPKLMRFMHSIEIFTII